MPRRIPRLHQGSPVNHNWRAINELAEVVGELQNREQITQADIRMLRTRPRDMAGGIYQAEVQTWDHGDDFASLGLATYDAETDAWVPTVSFFNAALPHLNRQDVKPDCIHPTAAARIHPDYAPGDIVLITKPVGGTGVEVNGEDLEWMILPNKRAWSFEHRICTPTNTYYQIIPGWEITNASNADFDAVE